MSEKQKRQLAAILFTDIVGYTAMMQADEQSAVVAINRHQEVLESAIPDFDGEVLNYFGDGSLSIFSSAVDSVKCAMQIQEQLREAPAVPLRIGIHIGEISFDKGKVFGDGVNIASRIESLGQTGTVLFSRHVFDKIKNKPEFEATSLGRFAFKNVEEPMEVFALSNNGFPVPERASISGKLKNNEKNKSWINWKTTIVVMALAFLFIFMGAKLNGFLEQKHQTLIPKHYHILLSEDHPINLGSIPNNTSQIKQLDISPLGNKLVYTGKKDNHNALFVRTMDSWESKLIKGTENAFHPFFSPNGQWVAFYADKKLKKVSLIENDPVPITICDVSLPYGAVWGEGNTILFINNEADAICKVSADGGKVNEVWHVQSASSNLKLGGLC